MTQPMSRRGLLATVVATVPTQPIAAVNTSVMVLMRVAIVIVTASCKTLPFLMNNILKHLHHKAKAYKAKEVDNRLRA